MAPSPEAARRYSHRRQGGAALLLFMLIVVIGASYMLLDRLNAGSIRTQATIDSVQALKVAKEALLGRAISDGNRPGSLPCPDTDGDGVAELLAGNDCAGGYLGRLPYRSLELDELRDGSGGRLWYALSRNFRDDDSAEPINSETEADLRVDDAADIVAVIIAPGKPFDWQDRSASPNDATQYLEALNADSDPKDYTATTTASINDSVAFITHAELMEAVEKRVLREARKKLEEFYDDNVFYPYAALLGSQEPYRGAWKGLRRGSLPVDPEEGDCTCSVKLKMIGMSLFRRVECECTAKAINTEKKVFELDSSYFVSIDGNCILSGSKCTCGLQPGQKGKCLTAWQAFPGVMPNIDIDMVDGVFTEAKNGCAGKMTGTCYCSASSANGECKAEVTQGIDMPAWFTNNNWDQLIYYTVSPERSEAGGTGRITVGSDPSAPSAGALVIAAGPGLPGTNCNGVAHDQSRPSEDVCDYLDSQENTDGDDAYTDRNAPITGNYWDRIELVKP